MTTKTKTKREDVIDQAKALIVGDREDQYGSPATNFSNIAKLWNVRIGHKLKPEAEILPSDVAALMVLVKVARDIAGIKEDSTIDTIGYAALYAELAQIEKDQKK